MEYDKNLKKELLDIVNQKSVIFGTVTLSSGKTSPYYIDTKMTSLSRDGVVLCAKLFYQQLSDIKGVGGPTLGADPFLGAILYECWNNKKDIFSFIVRKASKAHGTQKSIEGPIEKNTNVAIIEDVITTGKSVYEAIITAEQSGLKVNKVLTVVDREEGGTDFLEGKGYPVYPIFKKSELKLS